MGEETNVDAGMMVTGMEQMEEGKMGLTENGGSPESPKKLIIDEEVWGNRKLIGLVVHQGAVFHH